MSHEASVETVSFTLDDSHLMTTCRESDWQHRTARLWQAAASPVAATMGEGDMVRGVAVSSDGGYIATAGVRFARVWKAPAGVTVGEPIENQSGFSVITFSPDGRLLATAGDLVRIWDRGSHQILTRLYPASWVDRVAFGPGGKFLAAAKDDGTVDIWQMQGSSGRLVGGVSYGEALNAVSVSSDGKLVAGVRKDDSVMLLPVRDTKTGKGVKSEPLAVLSHKTDVSALAFCSDKRCLATASGNSVCVWDAGLGKQIWQSNIHEDRVQALAFTADGLRLATASRDRTVRFWEATAGRNAANL